MVHAALKLVVHPPLVCECTRHLLHLPPITRRRKKLREVGLVTTICATCFLFRRGGAGAGGVGAAFRGCALVHPRLMQQL